MSKLPIRVPAVARFHSWRRRSAAASIAFGLLSLLLTSSPAQVLGLRAGSPGQLPAPTSQAAVQTAHTAAVSGAVVDPTGAGIAAAHVVLVRLPGEAEQETTTGANGAFSFSALPAGRFRLSVTAPGFETVVLDEIQLAPGEQRPLPFLRMAVATASSQVQVTVTDQQLAAEQVREEEKQRVLGVFPNFYTSYLWQAAPLRPRQKYSLGIRAVIDPTVFAGTAIAAELEQVHNTFPGYGGGASGYGKRYGATYADAFTARIIGSSILPSLLHQDPRYFYKGTGSKMSRLRYAVGEAFLCRGDNGRQQVNYSYILGDFAAAGLSNAYRSAGDRSAGLTIENGFIILAGHMGDDLAREFLFKRFSTNIPAYAKGQP
jgi:hypothetical protein